MWWWVCGFERATAAEEIRGQLGGVDLSSLHVGSSDQAQVTKLIGGGQGRYLLSSLWPLLGFLRPGFVIQPQAGLYLLVFLIPQLPGVQRS